MQHSRSLGSFICLDNEADRDESTVPPRAVSRSSLDTLTIPGRTRLPSQKPDLWAAQVAENLLKSSMERAKRPLPEVGRQDDLLLHPMHLYPRSSSEGHDSGLMPYPRSPRSQHDQDEDTGSLIRTPRQPSQGNSYDGANESSYGSRVTSTTWSSVSKLSAPNFGQFAGPSHGLMRAKCNEEYNALASKHDLPPLLVPSNGDGCLKPRGDLIADCTQDLTMEKTSIKADAKDRKQGWVRRKLFPNSISSYSYKAKTTYKPISRRKSISRMVSDGSRKNILDKKSLEETCRLGGTGFVKLPQGFAVDRLTLPTCLSATAVYLLEHGVNAPGLFRVSGQTTIVNALYDYYSHQFFQAGSPSKVQTTVQPGQLPLHIEYALPDVASFFKKVLNGLPGGLLGSVELFNSLRAIFLNEKLEPLYHTSQAEATSQRARLIALAVSSLHSPLRTSLIQAVLGLFAYLGQEAEKARQASPAGGSGNLTKKELSELMGFQSLGVCLGPLLIGNLIDRVNCNDNGEGDNPRISSESNSRAKKKRLSTGSAKLDTSSALEAHVDRANLSASIMQLLLLTWPEVVTQLSIITNATGASSYAENVRRPKRSSSQQQNQHAIKVSDEELHLLKLMRSGVMRESIPSGTTLKRKIKARSRSRMLRMSSKDASQTSLGHHQISADVEPSILPLLAESSSSLQHLSKGRPDPDVAEDARVRESGSPVERRRRPKALKLDPMAMGQILPPRTSSHQASFTSSHASILDQQGNRPATADPRILSSTASPGINKGFSVSQDSINADHTSQKELPEQHRASSSAHDWHPPRKSSLHLKTPTFTGPQNEVTDLDREGDIKHDPNHEYKTDVTPTSDSLKPGAPRFLTQPDYGDVKLTPRSAGNVKGLRAKTTLNPSLPVVHALIRPLPSETSPLDDPFATLTVSSFLKETQIPKPVNSVGRDRQTSSLPCTPKRESYSPVKPQSLLLSAEKRTESVQPGTTDVGVQTAKGAQGNTDGGPHLASSTRSTTEPIFHRDSLDIPGSTVTERGRSKSRSPSAGARDADSPPLTVKRSGSVNTALYAQITRLQKEIEQKNEEINTTRRSLEAARASREGGLVTDAEKGTLSEKVREAKKERDIWRSRAEDAEKRLASLGVLAQSVAKQRRDTTPRTRNGMRSVDLQINMVGGGGLRKINPDYSPPSDD